MTVFGYTAASRPVSSAVLRAGASGQGRFSQADRFMKVRSSVRKMCDRCKIIKRKGVVRVLCSNPKHKQRQG